MELTATSVAWIWDARLATRNATRKSWHGSKRNEGISGEKNFSLICLVVPHPDGHQMCIALVLPL